MQILSGTATVTRKFVDAVNGTKTKILDEITNNTFKSDCESKFFCKNENLLTSISRHLTKKKTIFSSAHQKWTIVGKTRKKVPEPMREFSSFLGSRI